MATEQEWAALKEAAKFAGPAFWVRRGTCVYFGDGCFDLRDVPYPLARAAYIALANPATILALEAEHSRLRAENERLRTALEPFAKAGELFAEPAEIFDQWVFLPAAGEEYALTGNHLRAARAALAQEGE